MKWSAESNRRSPLRERAINSFAAHLPYRGIIGAGRSTSTLTIVGLQDTLLHTDAKRCLATKGRLFLNKSHLESYTKGHSCQFPANERNPDGRTQERTLNSLIDSSSFLQDYIFLEEFLIEDLDCPKRRVDPEGPDSPDLKSFSS